MALVITFVPDPAKAVTEMVRVVRPGGSVATYIWDVQGEGPPFQPLINALEAMNVNVPFLAGAENARLDTLNDLFETAGLAEVATRKCGATIRIALARQSEWNRATLEFNHWVHHNFDCSPGILARQSWPFGPPPLAASGLTAQDTGRPVQP